MVRVRISNPHPSISCKYRESYPNRRSTIAQLSIKNSMLGVMKLRTYFRDLIHLSSKPQRNHSIPPSCKQTKASKSSFLGENLVQTEQQGSTYETNFKGCREHRPQLVPSNTRDIDICEGPTVEPPSAKLAFRTVRAA